MTTEAENAHENLLTAVTRYTAAVERLDRLRREAADTRDATVARQDATREVALAAGAAIAAAIRSMA